MAKDKLLCLIVYLVISTASAVGIWLLTGWRWLGALVFAGVLFVLSCCYVGGEYDRRTEE